jgi:phenylalanyl-tRNA synthetase alpha chain
MSTPASSGDVLRRALSIRDLTDPASGPHALQALLRELADALGRAWGCEIRVHRADPVVRVEDNYDSLHYPAGAAARDARYTRYVGPKTMLRSHTTAMIPPLLRGLAAEPTGDVLLVCPGIVYRRDCIGRLHSGEPHQADLWRIRSGEPLAEPDMDEMVARVTRAVLPERKVRCTASPHPYTLGGRQIDVEEGERWVEIGECGRALPALLAGCGLAPARVSGLAMGLGLDRLLMLRKGVEDIRLLRSSDPRVSAQMLDLEPWRPVSAQPAVRRDLSIAIAAGTTAEELGDRVRGALGARASSVEAVEVLAETPCEALPPAAVERLGISSGQTNALVRLVLRDLGRALTAAEANHLRDLVYSALHEGRVWQWACGGPPEPR